MRRRHEVGYAPHSELELRERSVRQAMRRLAGIDVAKRFCAADSRRSKPDFGRPRLQPLHGLADALLHAHLWLPAQSHPGFANVRTAPSWIIFRKRTVHNRRGGTRDPQYELCQISNSELFRISKVNRAWFCRIN